jgi:crossover junction endodeoxyribonuclease RuvC
MFALGIDPGLSRCGYGAVMADGPDLRAVATGHLTTPPDEELSIRLGMLLSDLRELLEWLKPEVVVVERVLFQTNARTAMSVGQASGLALAVSAEARIPVVQYSPNEVKQAVVGYGAATKDQVQRMVQVLLGLSEPPRPADRADALALAICHLAGHRLRSATAAGAGGPVRLGGTAGSGTVR